ncbi:MAG TPA: undecaprenyl-diphosphate phosphatase [Clostridiales bacterium]|nr:undecaprenyl-diphosphate phosphatase [Clostridiales bacterium]HRT82529.1 undecaprenyl-diphosphate phosphatase [Oscillospiraceae bacterium]
MGIIEYLKVLLIGFVEGITEWLPVSSTGHMILLDEFIKLKVSEDFMEMFRVVIQLGAIMAVVVLYFGKLFPFMPNKSKEENKQTWILWFKVLVASIPAGIIGVLFDDKIDELFYNPWTVAVTLILYGIAFIFVEARNKKRSFKTESIGQMTFLTAFTIGVFQVLALIPGTSRSGATIIGAMLIGTSRAVAAEFTFFLAVPAMFAASFLKILKFGFDFTGSELGVLLLGMVTAFLVSVFAIKFLMTYIKKHDFKLFGWYRIALGAIVLLYFALIKK